MRGSGAFFFLAFVLAAPAWGQAVDSQVYASPEQAKAAAARPPSLELRLPAPAAAVLPPLGPDDLERLQPQARPNAIGVHRTLPAGAVQPKSAGEAAGTTVEGAWQTTAIGRLWRLRITSPGARALRIHFQDFDAGKGSVWVHAADGQMDGPHGGRGMYGDGDFWSGVVFGDSATIEYRPGPAEAAFGEEAAPFRIAAVSHIWGGFGFAGDQEPPAAAAKSANTQTPAAKKFAVTAGRGLSAAAPSSTSAAAAAAENPQAGALAAGRPAGFRLAPVERPTLFNGDRSFRLEVGGAVSGLTFDLSSVDPGVDVDLYVRYGQDVELREGKVVADYSSEGFSGNERIVVAPPRGGPLRAGTWFAALRLYAAGAAAEGTITAYMEPGRANVVPTSCSHLDPTCYPEWSTAARGVALIHFEKNGMPIGCSATLMNDRRPGYMPYLLTAAHCVESEEVARTVTAFWNYQTRTCNGTAPSKDSVPQTRGAHLLRRTPDTSGNWYDFLLEFIDKDLPKHLDGDAALLLLKELPSGRDLFFQGWHADFINSGPAVQIHHPATSYKRISFGNIRPDKSWITPFRDNDYMYVRYTRGTAEGGSSGSGLLSDSAGEFKEKLVGIFSYNPTRGPCASRSSLQLPGFSPFSKFFPRVRMFLGETYPINLSIVTKVAGTFGEHGYSGDGDQATRARLYNPKGLAVAGNSLFIADDDNNRIRRVDLRTNRITTVAGTGSVGFNGDGTATRANLYSPWGVDVAGNYLYIADRDHQRVRRVDLSTNTITTVAGTGTYGYSGDGGQATQAHISRPQDVAVGDGYLYIAQAYHHRIRRVNLSTGTITTVAGTGTAGYSGDGGRATQARLYHPWGVDVAGNYLYIADRYNNRIRRVNLNTNRITTVAGTGSRSYGGDGGQATEAHLNRPTGVAVDGASNIYIADTENHRIRKVDTPGVSGIITTVAGTGTAGNSTGVGVAVRLRSPQAVEVSGNYLYISDMGNQVIRRLEIEAPTDDHGDTPAEATALSAGSSVQGRIETSRDVDYFWLQIPAQSDVEIYTTGSLDTVGSLRDSSNAEIAGNDNGGAVRNFRIARRLAAGVYYIAVRSFGSDTGSYTLHASVAGGGTPPPTVSLTASPGSIQRGGSATLRWSSTNAASARIDQGIGNVATSGSRTVSPTATTTYRITVTSADGRTAADSATVTVTATPPPPPPDATGIITTVAGTRTQGYSGDGGQATRARLDNPRGLAVAGNSLFIADDDNNRIRRVDLRTNRITTVAGTGSVGFNGDGTATRANLYSPWGVDVAGNYLYIADRDHQRVRRVDLSTNTITTVAGTGTYGYSGDGGQATQAHISRPQDVAVGDGYLYIAQAYHHRIRRVNLSTGTITTVAGTGTAGYSGDGGRATQARLYHPWGVDVAGNYLYIADRYNNRIRRVNLNTNRITTVAGTGSRSYGGDGGQATEAHLNRPTGVAVDGASNIYIADTENHRIRKVDTPGVSGIITTVAGTGTAGYSTGVGAAARLRSPQAVEVSGNYLYISDMGNQVIRRLEIEAPTDDHGDTPAEATALSAGSSVQGRIETGDDVDYFRLQIPAQSDVEIYTTGSLDTVGSLRDSSNAGIDGNDDGGTGTNFRIARRLAAGVYYIAVSSFGSDTGSYTLHASVAGGGTPPPTVSLTASPGSIQRGGSATLRWSSTNAASARIDQGIGNVATSGSRTVSPTATTTYRITVTSADGRTAADSATVTVTASPPTPTDDHGDTPAEATALSAGSSVQGRIETGDDVDYFRLQIPAQSDVEIYTTGSLDTVGSLRDSSNAGIAENDDGGTGTNFRIARRLAAGVYYIAVSSFGSGTGSYTLHASVAGGGTPPPTVSLTASPGSIQRGGSATLRWSSTNAASARIDQGIGNVATSGSRTVSPTATTTYRITVTSADGRTAADSATVTVTATPPPPPPDATGIITTVAGTRTQGYSGDGGQATRARLDNPRGLAVAGNSLFIADDDNNRIRRVDLRTNRITTVAGTGSVGFNGDGTATRANLYSPWGVDVAGNYLYIADRDHQRVRRVDLSTNTITTVAGTGTYGYSGDGGQATQAHISRPQDVAVGDGYLYIAQAYHHRIRRVNLSTGTITTVAGTGTAGYSGDGGRATQARLYHPWGVDVAGNYLYIADRYNNRIRRVNLNTNRITTVAGTGSRSYGGDGGQATEAHLNRPTGVAVDGASNIYIADTENHRIRKVDTPGVSGIITTVAGTGTAGYSTGVGAAARLRSPQAVEVSGNYLYISDMGNQVIRRLEIEAPTDDHGDTPAEATALSAGSSVQGRIETGDDVDYFRLQIPAQSDVEIYTTGSLDTVGSLRDSSNAGIDGNDDGGTGTNFRIARRLAAGVYYIAVSSFGSGTGSYTLHMSVAGGGTAPPVSLRAASQSPRELRS